MTNDRRLIEDFLPIEAISKEASREKSLRKGHISTLHLWWARRPLVACRAAVYGALVPASRFIPENGPEDKKKSLGRANAARFLERLCKYPGDPTVIQQARRHILEAHAERLTRELGKPVTVEDIEASRAPRPKVLDMFAGGGSIPLEALRLGCDAYAMDLNPVAYIILLCTLVYPQKYGQPDPNARGMTGPKNASGETTWGGLANEVRYWGEWVLKRVKAEIGDLYPPLPDPSWWSVGQAASLAGQRLLFPSVKQGVAKTRRKLPHWEKQGGCYFVTYRTQKGIVLPERARDVVLQNWKHWSGQRYELWQAVVMPDEVQLLLSPLPREDGSYWTLPEILRAVHSETTRQISALLGQQGPVWQDEWSAQAVPNPASFEKNWHSIRQSPCKNGLALRPEEYPWLYEDDWLAARPTLTPVAYLWTRTVRCKNPACGATVPLVRQTWLCKKRGRYVALKMIAPKGEKRVRFEVVESRTEEGLGFDPAAFSKAGNATCPFCGTVADNKYVKAEGRAKRIGQQMMAIVCTRSGQKGKVYLSADDFPEFHPDDEAIQKRIVALCQRTGLTVPSELIEANPRSMDTQHFGFNRWGDLFTPRQMLCLLTFAAAVRQAQQELAKAGVNALPARAVTTYLCLAIDREAEDSSSLCRWNANAQKMQGTYGRQALPMVWDFCEASPFGGAVGDWLSIVDLQLNSIEGAICFAGVPGAVTRGSATALPWPDASFDAVVTDPPYYDNVSYSNLSDFFYVWLKRTIGHLHPEHFALEATPKKSEVIAAFYRHDGDKTKSREFYEQMMAQAFAEANRVLKPGSPLVAIYAHKSALGWATLVEALRSAGFTVTEAWPLDTEMKARLVAMDSAALASSIFLVARKREGESQAASLRPDQLAAGPTGSYEDEVRPELEQIVRERVDSLWRMGITGADLVIAAVGAGLRAFTRFARVEYANGEEVPAERFLAEVEGLVLETLLEKIFRVAGAGVSAVDGPTRFYVLWRYTYGTAEMDAGEAIVFTYGQNVELDGPRGLSTGNRALVQKKKGTYRLRDFTERGSDTKLGLRGEDGAPAPLIDSLHRMLWLLENEPRKLKAFLKEVQPEQERLRLVAQTLAGTALEGNGSEGRGHVVRTTPAETAALKKLLTNWRALVEQPLPLFDQAED